MDVLILAGGYAKRLRPLSEYIPKPLFPLQGVPLLNYIIERVEEIKPERIILSTNKRFEYHFRYWLKNQDIFLRNKIELIIEPTLKEEEKFGALKGIHHCLKEAWIENDTLIVAGDNLFDFDLRKLYRRMKERSAITMASYDIKDRSKAKRFGVILKNENDEIISLEEKPENPKSSLICTGLYAIPKKYLSLFDKYFEEDQEYDNIGKFFEWIMKNELTKLYTYTYEGTWFDIGTLESYEKANKLIKELGLFHKWL